MFIKFLFSLALILFSATQCFSMEPDEEFKTIGTSIHHNSTALNSETRPEPVNHIPQLPDDYLINYSDQCLANIFLFAVDLNNTPKTLSLVCKKWCDLVHNDQIKKDLARRSGGIFQIDLSSFSTSEEVLAFLENQIPLHKNVFGLEFVETIPAASPLELSKIFPERFLDFKNLRMLGIKTPLSLDIDPFTDGMPRGADHTKLPTFPVIENLKEIDIAWVSGGGRRVPNFVGGVLPSLSKLERVSVGLSIRQEAGYFCYHITKAPNVKQVTVYHYNNNFNLAPECGGKERYSHLYNPNLHPFTPILLGTYSFNRLPELGWVSNLSNTQDKMNGYLLRRLLAGVPAPEAEVPVPE